MKLKIKAQTQKWYPAAAEKSITLFLRPSFLHYPGDHLQSSQSSALIHLLSSWVGLILRLTLVLLLRRSSILSVVGIALFLWSNHGRRSSIVVHGSISSSTRLDVLAVDSSVAAVSSILLGVVIDVLQIKRMYMPGKVA